tara:strand:- start:1855 stop:2739 length:885 start_codon:yes stop_codon:yes gene_type:complete
MGFLQEGDAERMRGMMLGEETPQAEEPAQEAAPAEEPAEAAPVEEAEPASSSDTAGDVKVEAEGGAEAEPQKTEASDSQAEEEEVQPGHRVPYTRFKEVIEARNQFKTETAELKAQLEQLREQAQRQASQPAPVQAAPQPKADDDEAWLKELLGEDEPTAQKSVDPALQQLSARLHETEVALARQSLEAEVSAAIQKYPSATRDVILQAVAQNPSLSAENVAEQYSAWMAQVEEEAIARYLKDNPAAAKPAAAPRPAKSGAVEAPVSSEAAKPKNVKEGSEALRAFLKGGNPFA